MTKLLSVSTFLYTLTDFCPYEVLQLAFILLSYVMFLKMANMYKIA